MAGGIQLLDHNGKPLLANRNGFALPPVLTTSGIYQGAYKTYMDEKYDEALRQNRDDGLSMWRDCWIRSLINERIDSVLGLKWSVEVDNPKDQRQKMVADGLTKAIQRTPRLRAFFRQQLLALWYGRYANQVKWKWGAVDVDGKAQRVLTVAKHVPVNGDKIGYQWQNPETGQYEDTPFIRVNSSYTDDALGKAEYIYSSFGKAVLLKGTWRDRFLIHTHNPQDADFLEGDMQGGIHGCGIRSVIYWNWWMREDGWGMVWEQLERIGLGLVIIYYDESSDASLEAAQRLAANYSRRAVVTIPRPAGGLQSRYQAGANGLEVVECPTGAIEVVQALRQDLEAKIERYIVGQNMSGGKDDDNGDGFGGTGQSKFAQDTKRNITVGDANDLEETQTGSEEEPGLLSVIKAWSYPWADFPCRFKFTVDEEDPDKRLESISKAASLGVTFKMDSVRGLTGQEKPSADDEVIGGQQAMPGMGGMPGVPGGGPDAASAGGGTAAAALGGDTGGDAGASEDGDNGSPDGTDSGDDTSAFLDFLNGLNGDGASAMTYSRDPWEVILYAPEDWVSGTPSRGPNKGKQGWHNTRTKKWLFGAHPGVGEAQKEEAKGQKKAAKQEANQAKATVGAAKKQANADAPGKAIALIEQLRKQPAPNGAKELASLLGSMRVADLKSLKGHFGLKASGVKAQMAAQIAQRALGDGPPVGGGHPVQPTLAGVAKAMGIDETEAKSRLGADAAAFESMLAKLSEKGSEPLSSTQSPSNEPSSRKGREPKQAELPQSASRQTPQSGQSPVSLRSQSAATTAASQKKTASPANTANPATHQQAVSDAFNRLNTRGYNLVSLADLRDELAKSGVSDRSAQDAAIHEMRKQGRLSLSGVEGRHAVSNPAEHQRQMAAAIREGNEVLGNVAMRAGAKPAQPSTPSKAATAAKAIMSQIGTKTHPAAIAAGLDSLSDAEAVESLAGLGMPSAMRAGVRTRDQAKAALMKWIQGMSDSIQV